jgi:rare lipoprotein A
VNPTSEVGARVAASILVVGLCGAALAGCATTSGGRPVGRRAALVEEGRASYYGQIFDGRRTASGERYDPERMTAAHPSLPFGTWVRVTRHDGRWVEVRVNDRCGCGGGRIVDLSRAAARRLDMIRAGTVAVRLEVIEK